MERVPERGSTTCSGGHPATGHPDGAAHVTPVRIDRAPEDPDRWLSVRGRVVDRRAEGAVEGYPGHGVGRTRA